MLGPSRRVTPYPMLASTGPRQPADAAPGAAAATADVPAPARLSPQVDASLGQAVQANLARPDGRAPRQRRHCGALFSAFLRNLTSQGLAILAGLSVRACTQGALASLGRAPAVAAGCTALVALAPMLVHAAAGAQCAARMARDRCEAGQRNATIMGAALAPLMLPLGLAIAAGAGGSQGRLGSAIAVVAMAVGRDATHLVRELVLAGYDMLTLRDRDDGVGGRLARSRVVPWSEGREATHPDSGFDRFERDQVLLQALAYGVMVAALGTHLTPWLGGKLSGQAPDPARFDELIEIGLAGAAASTLAEALDGVLAGLCAMAVAHARFGGSATHELTFRWPQAEGELLPDWQARGATRIAMNTVQDLGNGLAIAARGSARGLPVVLGVIAFLAEGLVEGGMLRIAAADRRVGAPAVTDMQEAPPPAALAWEEDAGPNGEDLEAEAAALRGPASASPGTPPEAKRNPPPNTGSTPPTSPRAPHSLWGRGRRALNPDPSSMSEAERAKLVGRPVVVASPWKGVREDSKAARMVIAAYDPQNQEFVVDLRLPLGVALRSYLYNRVTGMDGKGGWGPLNGRTRFKVGELRLLQELPRSPFTSPSASRAGGPPTGYGAGTRATR